MEAILSKLLEKQNLNDILKLIKKLTEKAITLDSNSANVIYNKLDENARSEFAKIELAIALKENDINLNLPHGCFWDKSLDSSRLFKKNAKLGNDNNNNDKNENNIINNDKNDEKNEEYRECLIQTSLALLESRLRELPVSKINSEKNVWIKMSDDMEKEELLSKEQKTTFNSIIEDAYDVNCFLTALQWLAVKLCVIFTGGAILEYCAPIRDRWDAGVKNTRIFERLQESKDNLLEPLKRLASNANVSAHGQNRDEIR